jgi:hypothetical protein
MTSPETLNPKIPVNELTFPVVTHTAHSDTRLGRYRLLKSSYDVDQILGRLDIEMKP